MRLSKKALLLVALAPLLANSQCSNWSGGGGDTAPAVQGWTPSQTIAWYTASQGSRLIPQVWFDNLEQPDAAKPFLDPTYIASFRYLPNPSSGWTALTPPARSMRKCRWGYRRLPGRHPFHRDKTTLEDRAIGEGTVGWG